MVDKETIMIIVIAVSCVVVFVILVVFVSVGCHVYKRRKKEVGNPKRGVTDVDEVDAVLRAESGKKEHVVTTNPAFGKDFFNSEGVLASKPVDLAQEFDGELEEGKEPSETGSNYSFTPDNMQDTNQGNRLSILDQTTWGGVHADNVPLDADLDFNMFRSLRGLHSKSESNLPGGQKQKGQYVADLYESGQALTMNGAFTIANPCLNHTTGRLWQKQRFKNF